MASKQHPDGYWSEEKNYDSGPYLSVQGRFQNKRKECLYHSTSLRNIGKSHSTYGKKA